MSVLAFKIFGYTYWQILVIGFIGLFFWKIIKASFGLMSEVNKCNKWNQEVDKRQQKLLKEMGLDEYGNPIKNDASEAETTTDKSSNHK